MTFRNNNNNNRRNNQGGNFNNNNNNNYGGTISRGNVNPWMGNDGPNMGNMGGGRGNNDALALANNLLNNLLRNQNQNNVPPSLLNMDMAGPRGGYNDGPRGYNDFRVSTFDRFLVTQHPKMILMSIFKRPNFKNLLKNARKKISAD